MAVLGNNITTLKNPKVTFSIELRSATPIQLEAGKRLFSRLLVKAQASQKFSNEAKQINMKT